MSIAGDSSTEAAALYNPLLNEETVLSDARWKNYADWAKTRPTALKLADFLGRRRGRLALLDRLGKPSPAAPVRPDLSDWERHDLGAVWLGHATILLRIGGMTVLTDPVFSSRIGVGFGLFTGGPKRLTAPALNLDQLPPIDLILLSHAHFDHLDRPTLARMHKRIPVVTAHETADLVRDLGYRHIRELRWGEQADFGPLRLTAREVRHWGARTFQDTHRGFNAYVLETRHEKRRRVLYGGDTAYQDYFRDIGRVDLAILGIGAYEPYVAAHATPEQAWEMADHVRADALLPMHHSTFRLSYEPVDEPMERMMQVAGRDTDRVVVRQIGDTWSLAG